MNTFHQQNPKDSYLASIKLPALATPLSEAEAMQLALDFAWQGIGHVAPNPLVGCVITDADGRFIGAGAHLRCGEGHAEVNALKAVASSGNSDALSGATVFVTLEPCSHIGRTPACAATLAQLPLAKVVYAMKDPTTKVNGKGIALLEAAGISCLHAAAFEQAAIELVEVFLTNQLLQRPFIAIKAALSLDGSIARKGDQRQFLTGQRARQYGHFLRSYYDAIMVGARTVLLDQPSLDPRHSLFGRRMPLPIIYDPHAYALRQVNPDLLPMITARNSDKKTSSNAASGQNPLALWLLNSEQLQDETLQSQLDRLQRLNIAAIEIPSAPSKDSQLRSQTLFKTIYEKYSIRSILMEGGSSCYDLALASSQVDKAHLFYSPLLLTGDNRRNIVATIQNSSQWQINTTSITVLEGDWLVEGRLLKV